MAKETEAASGDPRSQAQETGESVNTPDSGSGADKQIKSKGINNLWVIAGASGGVVALVAVWFWLQPAPEPGVSQMPSEKSVPAPVKKSPPPQSKANIYQLEDFFFPLKKNGRETGRFIRVSSNFLLSDDLKRKNIESALPLIRRNIFNILRRKTPADFSNDKKEIKETIKKEILVTSNASLPKGVGIIEDVYFTQFVVK
jgi:flagellar basal body-associated protein FliL